MVTDASQKALHGINKVVYTTDQSMLLTPYMQLLAGKPNHYQMAAQSIDQSPAHTQNHTVERGVCVCVV